MPVPIRALEEAAETAARAFKGGAARSVVREAESGLRYVGGGIKRAGAATIRATKSVATSTGGKIAGRTALAGAGIYGGLTLAGAGIKNLRDGWNAPTTAGVGPIEALAPGVPVSAFADEAAAAYYQAQTRSLNTPDAGEFFTSWKGLIVIGIVAVVVVMILARKGK